MTTAVAIERCKTLADKWGSPSIEDDEWIGHLNMAQEEVLNKLIPDSLGGVVNVEMDSNTIENIKPLIYTLTIAPSASILTNSALTTALITASGDSGCSVFRILALAQGDILIKFVKHNNLFAYKNNVFKAPETDYPLFTITAGGYRLYPTVTLPVSVTVIKTPKVMTDGNSPDWDDYVMNQVIFGAVKLAGVGIRDEELIVNLRNTGVQSAQ